MSDFNPQRVRADFPALTQKIRGKNLVYLDSAASALKPWAVIERIGQFYTYETSNVHRGAHYLADRATTHFEEAREKVRVFLKAKEKEEIIYTAGTTDGLNHLAFSLGEKMQVGDRVLLTEMEHHANIVPWQMLKQRKGIEIDFAPVTKDGEIDLKAFNNFLDKKPRVVSFTHCSNTLGTINPVKQMTAAAKSAGALVIVDGAQAVSNFPVDVADLGVDFYVFSAHKLFGPYGFGILYGRREELEKLVPYRGGGSMINTVEFSGFTFNDLPFRLEAGTPHIEGALGLGAAIDYLSSFNRQQVGEYEHKLSAEALTKINNISGVEILGMAKERAPIVSFNLKGCHAADVGQILDQEGVAVRIGHHCTQPLLRKFGLSATIRASLSIYNNSQDIDVLIKGLRKAQEMLL